jgi:hypothetical protein
MRTKTKTRMSDYTKGVLCHLNSEDLQSSGCVAVMSSWIECVQTDADVPSHRFDTAFADFSHNFMMCLAGGLYTQGAA